jgi:hypothetical protein
VAARGSAALGPSCYGVCCPAGSSPLWLTRVGVERQVVVACNDDLARVRLRPQPGTEGLELLRPAGVREVARVDQAVASRQWLPWRRAVRVAHANEPHRAGRLRSRLLHRSQRQRPSLLPDAEHLATEVGGEGGGDSCRVDGGGGEGGGVGW